MEECNINLKYNADLNKFSLKIKDVRNNVFSIDSVESDEHSIFSKGNWVFVLFAGYSGQDIKMIHDLLEAAEKYPHLNFAFKPYMDERKIQEFTKVPVLRKVTPVVLKRKNNITELVSSSIKSKSEIIGLIEEVYSENKISYNKTCYLCNAFVDVGNNCPKCSGSFKRGKRKCIIDSFKKSSKSEILSFIKISELHFFQLENYETIVLGYNTISELIELLNSIENEHKEYEVMLALRMCGVEIWGSSLKNIRYTYRLPDEEVFNEIFKTT
ncbi:hypothetical protein OAT18_01565 [Tenacibaculum sp.]|nr:hypothetical protein [Tenacibaculum sp.]